MAQYQNLVLFSLLTLAAVHGSNAVDYIVSNNAGANPGGARFDKEIGADYAKKTLSSATDFIWKQFQLTANIADKKDVQTVSMIVENYLDGVAYSSNNEIHINANYINDFTEDIKKEITGVMYHELTHIWQWNGNGQAPRGLIHGIADFVRLKAGYAPDFWVKPGRGEDWNQGYDVTALFLDYCEGLKSGFVADLNKKMETSFSVSYFSDLLGKPVDELWNDYKTKYGIGM